MPTTKPTVTGNLVEQQPQGSSPTQVQRFEIMALSAIRRDPRLQCRISINQATIARYAERIKARDRFPLLDVFEIGESYFLVDGWHRYAAVLQLGLTRVRVRVHLGTWQDAIRFALCANSSHGLALSNRDKRRAVEIALRELPTESDRAIAACCKVSHTLVAKVRSQLATVASCTKRTGRDGKARKVPNQPSRGPGNPSVVPIGAAGSRKAAEACPPEETGPAQRWKLLQMVLEREFHLWPATARLELVQKLHHLVENWEALAGIQAA